MEFKQEDVKIVDEKKENLFGAPFPCNLKDDKQNKECARRWIESLSDCA